MFIDWTGWMRLGWFTQCGGIYGDSFTLQIGNGKHSPTVKLICLGFGLSKCVLKYTQSFPPKKIIPNFHADW